MTHDGNADTDNDVNVTTAKSRTTFYSTKALLSQKNTTNANVKST